MDGQQGAADGTPAAGEQPRRPSRRERLAQCKTTLVIANNPEEELPPGFSLKDAVSRTIREIRGFVRHVEGLGFQDESGDFVCRPGERSIADPIYRIQAFASLARGKITEERYAELLEQVGVYSGPGIEPNPGRERELHDLLGQLMCFWPFDPPFVDAESGETVKVSAAVLVKLERLADALESHVGEPVRQTAHRTQTPVVVVMGPPPPSANEGVTPQPAAAPEPGLTPCVRQAWASFQRAVSALPALADALDEQVHAWLKENPEPDYRLPDFDTWRRYVTKARRLTGNSKYGPRGGREGRSLQRPEQL